MKFVGGSTDQCLGSGEGCELCLNGAGYCKPTGSELSVSRVDGKGDLKDYYYLDILGPVGHPLRVILRSSDGYHRDWEQFGQLYTDKINKPGSQGRQVGATDHVQVQDMTTGSIAFFKFPCEPKSAPEDRKASTPLNINIYLNIQDRGVPGVEIDAAPARGQRSTKARATAMSLASAVSTAPAAGNKNGAAARESLAAAVSRVGQAGLRDGENGETDGSFGDGHDNAVIVQSFQVWFVLCV